MLRRVGAISPASSANLGAGFDVFAVALKEPYDYVEVERTDRKEIELVIDSKQKDIPHDAEKNVATAVAKRIVQDYSIRYASYGEFVASGVAHKDNVAASLLGGFIMLNSNNKLTFKKIEPKDNLAFCLAIPDVKLPKRKTEYSRSILPKQIPIEDAVMSISGASYIAAGFLLDDADMIGRGMMSIFVDKVRSKLIDGFEEVKDSAIKKGASGVCLSGAGPSVIAIVDRRKAEPADVVEAMVLAFNRRGIRAKGNATAAGGGASVVLEE